MAISQLNNILVKHSKILFGIFTFVIIVAFVCFFTPGLDIGIFASGALSRSSTVATVFGEKITLGEAIESSSTVDIAASAYSGVRPGMLNIPRDPDFMLPASQIIAKKMGIAVSREEIGACIRKFPAFQENKKFSAEKFVKYEKEILIPEGLNAQDLEKAVEKLMLMQAVFGSTPMGAEVFAIPRLSVPETFVTPLAFADYQRFMLEKFSATEIRFPYASFKVDPKKEELVSCHAANRRKFMTLPEYRADVIFFAARPAAKDAAAKYYAANKKNFTKGGKLQPFAEVSKEIEKILKNQALNEASARAGDFRDRLSMKVSAAGEVGSPEKYLSAFRDMALKGNMKIVRTPWINASTKQIKGFSSGEAIAKAVSSLEDNRSVTRGIQGTDGIFIAAVFASRPSVEKPLRDCMKEVREFYIGMKQKALAKEYAAKFLAEVKVKGAFADYRKAAGPYAKITSMKEASRETLSAPVSELAPGEFTKAFELQDGVSIFRLDKRTPPTQEECAKNKAMHEMFFKGYMNMSARTEMMEWINSNVKVNPDFQAQFMSRR